MLKRFLPALLPLALFSPIRAAESPATFPVTITVDAAHSLGPVTPLWRFFGCDEPNYTYMKDGRRLLGELGALAPERIAATSSAAVPLDTILRNGVRGAPDVGVFASRNTRQVTVLLWHYHDDVVAGPDADVAFTVTGLPADLATVRCTHYRVDETHSNAFAAWQRLGSPIAPNQPQYDEMLRASALTPLADAPATVPVAAGTASLHFALPRQAVSLVVLDLGS